MEGLAVKTVLRIVLVLSLCLCISAFLGTNAFAEEILVIRDDDIYAEDTQYYEITLNANGGLYGNDPSSVLKTTRIREGSSFYGGSYRPTHPNPRMIFTGWYYDPECAKLAVSCDKSFVPDSDLMLYAGWSEGWFVTFDANGGQFDSGNSTLLFTVPKGSPLSYSPYVQSADPNYEWDYWALEDGTRIETWEFVPEGDVTLYAHYIRLYRLTLDANGGFYGNNSGYAIRTIRIREGSSFYAGDYQPTNPDPHTAFTGWYYDANCTQLAIGRNGSLTPDNNLTLYAGWSEGWIVTFDANGGQIGAGASTIFYTVPKGSTLSYSPYVQSADQDQVLDYWALEDGTRIETWEFVPESDVVLYAHYFHFYNVLLNANGGCFDFERETIRVRIAKTNSVYTDLYSPTNPDPHMIFNGWYYDAACTSLAAARNGYFTPESDMTLYAGWSQGYILSYDANGGTGRPDKQTKLPGETLLISWDAPRREGFYFLGWAENADAETASYLPGENYTQDADVTLYALWGNPDFVLPDGLTEIEEEAFAGAAARFVKLPDSLASVGPRAFAGCTELQYIVIPDYLNQIDFSAFEGTENVIVLTFSQFHRLYRLPDYMRMMAP